MTQGLPSLPRAGRHCRECGATLVEILISILLMSFGLLAMGAMQAWSVAGAKSAGHRIVAALVAAEAADVLRGSPTAPEQLGGDPLAQGGGDPLAHHGLAALRSRTALELPQGELQVSRAAPAGKPGVAEVDVWVMWAEPRIYSDEEAGAGDAEQAFDNCPPEAKGQTPMPRCFYMRVAI